MTKQSIRVDEIVNLISTGDTGKWEESPRARELLRHLTTILVYLYPQKSKKSIIREMELCLQEDQVIFQEQIESVADQTSEFLESVEYWKPRISYYSPQNPYRSHAIGFNIPTALYLVTAYLLKGTHTRPERTCPECKQWFDTAITVCPNCGHDFQEAEQKFIANEYLIIWIFSSVILLFIAAIALLDQLKFLRPFLLPGFITLLFGFVEGREVIRNWPDHRQTAKSLAKRIRWTFAVFDILMVCGIVWGIFLHLNASTIHSRIIGVLGMLMIVGGCGSGLIPGITAFRHGMFPQTPGERGFKTVWVRGTMAKIGAAVWILFFFLAGLASVWFLIRFLFSQGKDHMLF
jgi:hypothetical protein